METRFFNYRPHWAHNTWDRWAFVHNWWRIEGRDERLAPPHYPLLRRELEPGRNPHLARMEPQFVYVEAFSRSQGQEEGLVFGPGMIGLQSFEIPLAAGIGLIDPRRKDQTAYLAMLRCANDKESLERLLDALAGEFQRAGCTRLIGPVGLSPHLGSGMLLDGWDQLPPLFTPYNPPFLPEISGSLFQPLRELVLYRISGTEEEKTSIVLERGLEITTIEPERLVQDLFPVFRGVFVGGVKTQGEVKLGENSGYTQFSPSSSPEKDHEPHISSENGPLKGGYGGPTSQGGSIRPSETESQAGKTLEDNTESKKDDGYAHSIPVHAKDRAQEPSDKQVESPDESGYNRNYPAGPNVTPAESTSEELFPAPDRLEAEFLLRWCSQAPLTALAAFQEGEPVGFVLLCPDLARAYARARGGRSLYWRYWLKVAMRRGAREGRLLFGGVLPGFRGRGVGRALLSAALEYARSAGWEHLSVGPVLRNRQTARFLERHGAALVRSYEIYLYDF